MPLNFFENIISRNLKLFKTKGMYTLTNDMRSWLQALIDLMQPGTRKTQAQSWGDTHTTCSNDDLYVLVSLYVNDSDLYPQAQSFSDWVKGGVRPGHPH